MPNVPPNGFHARVGTAWRTPPINVWARVGGIWKQAETVYAMSGGVWKPIWGRLAARPATATATWVQPATVRIDWTAPAVNSNTQWIVRRYDGSIVGVVPVGTLTLIDVYPPLHDYVTGVVPAYTVEGSDGTTSSPTTRATNTVPFNVNPATINTSVAYPSGSTATVTITWTPNATYGRPSGWRVYTDGGMAVTGILSGTATSATVGITRGGLGYLTVVPMYQFGPGTSNPLEWSKAGAPPMQEVAAKAINPADVYMIASPGFCNSMSLAWTHPGGYRTGYQVAFSSDGVNFSGASTVSDSTVGVRVPDITFPLWGRVRTISDGGSSDWVTVYGGPPTPC